MTTTTDPCHAARTGEGYWTCDVPGGCGDCKTLAAELGDDMFKPPTCLDAYDGDCAGPVEYQMPLSGTGTPFPRCDRHWSIRLDREEQILERYPEHPPSDWSPADAGEAWYEDE